MNLNQIATFINGELVGDPDLEISGLAKIEEAGPGELSFLANPKYTKYLTSTKASAVLVSREQTDVPISHIKVDDPYLGFLLILEQFNPPNLPNFSGIHPSAIVDPDAKIGENVTIGPMVYVGKDVSIGQNTIIFPGCVLMDRVLLGSDCKLYPNVTVREECVLKNNVIIHNGTVIGSDGFGYAPTDTGYRKIPQLGIVRIEDNCEIGSNCTIDRATLGETVIKKGCKLDNLIQIAHNVVVDENTVIAAQTGISGSTHIGKNVTIAGQVGTVGHIKIGDKSIIAAKSGVSKDVPEGEVWFGYPAQQIMRQKKVEASLRHLPEMAKRVHQLERTIIELEEKIKKMSADNEG
jgi:UDP-3-O-[3-hydroxymyristoyl] glucosamine N-acyltransferase